MKCNQCGTENSEEAKYCMSCGEELSSATPPVTSHPPPTVIIQERTRKGIPGIIWMLVGMVLVTLICGLLVWFDFVDVPDQLRARLPGPVGDLVDAIEDAHEPVAPDDEDPEEVITQDQTQPPGQPPGQDVQQPPDQPSQPQPEPTSEACNEELSITALASDNEYYTGMGSIQFSVTWPVESEYYDVSIVHEPSGEETSRVTCKGVNFERAVGNEAKICWQEGYVFEWYAGASTIIIRPEGEDCILAEFPFQSDCNSGQNWYANWSHGSPRGCCTIGCWCYNSVAGADGCWVTCAPACYD